MFSFCTDPSTLPDWQWWACYLTTGKHLAFYASFGTVLLLLALAAPAALALGLAGALAARSTNPLLAWPGRIYTAMVRGVPDIIFFLFVPLALDQLFEIIRHRIKCPDWEQPIWQGNDFVVCPAAKLPLSSAPQWVHEVYGFTLALIAFAIVFGAFAANTLRGAMDAVPKGQIEAAEAYGFSRGQIIRRILLPQMWIYALPGLGNLWQILIKATPLLFLLGVEDVVYWAKELGSSKTSAFAYPHPDWRLWYFLALLVWYLGLTKISEAVFARLDARVSRGIVTVKGGNGA